MSSQHKAPLAAFVVVTIACIVVLANALHSDALTAFLRHPAQSIVAGIRVAPAEAGGREAEVVGDAADAAPAAPRAETVEHAAPDPAPAVSDRPEKAGKRLGRERGIGSPAMATHGEPGVASAPAQSREASRRGRGGPYGHWFGPTLSRGSTAYGARVPMPGSRHGDRHERRGRDWSRDQHDAHWTDDHDDDHEHDHEDRWSRR